MASVDAGRACQDYLSCPSCRFSLPPSRRDHLQGLSCPAFCLSIGAVDGQTVLSVSGIVPPSCRVVRAVPGSRATAARLLAGQPAAVGRRAGALRAAARAAAPGDQQLLALHRRRPGAVDRPDCAGPPGPVLLLAGWHSAAPSSDAECVANADAHCQFCVKAAAGQAWHTEFCLRTEFVLR